MVATIAAAVALVEVKDGTFPEPLAAKPIAVLLFVQVKVDPPILLVNEVLAMVAPGHTIILVGTVTFGNGLTVIVPITVVPTQPPVVVTV
jgi:hypothetical protein